MLEQLFNELIKNKVDELFVRGLSDTGVFNSHIFDTKVEFFEELYDTLIESRNKITNDDFLKYNMYCKNYLELMNMRYHKLSTCEYGCSIEIIDIKKKQLVERGKVMWKIANLIDRHYPQEWKPEFII